VIFPPATAGAPPAAMSSTGRGPLVLVITCAAAALLLLLAAYLGSIATPTTTPTLKRDLGLSQTFPGDDRGW